MYKTELVRRVAKQTRLPQQIVNDVLSASHGLIEEALRQGGTVTFPGFGTFYAADHQERTVRHIRTGEIVTIAARSVPTFRAGDVLKRVVAGQPRARRRRISQ